MIETAEDVRAHMEQLGTQTVREMLTSGQWPENHRALANAWLAQKDSGGHERVDVHRADAQLVAQQSNEMARSARDAARDAHKMGEDAIALAREAKSLALAVSDSSERIASAVTTIDLIAKVALAAAIIAIGISTALLFMK